MRSALRATGLAHGDQRPTSKPKDRRPAWRIAAMVSLAVLPASAHAQLLEELIATDIAGPARDSGVTVASRRRADFESLGIRLGNFTIRPELRESVGYDDNVTGTHKGKGSPIIETNAIVGARYDHSDGSATARLSVDDTRYPDRQSQSTTDWAARIGGIYNVGRDTASASFEHLNLTQTQRDLDVPQLDRGIAYRVDTLRTAYKAVFNRLFVQPGVSLASYDYDDGTAAGVRYAQGYRNRLVITPSITVGYELQPRRNLVLVVRNANAQYSKNPFQAAKRNYNDISALAGVDYDADGIWRYRLLVGYESRSFDSRQYKTISAPVIETAVIWSPTGLTTVTASATRHIQDSADDVSVGTTETAVALRVDHELLRNVLLQADAAYYLNEYNKSQSGQSQSSQSLYRFGAGVTWLVNRNIALVGTADRIQRQRGGVQQSGGQQPQASRNSFIENRFLLSLRLAL